MSQLSDEAAIRRLVDLFTEGWNAKDGKACARPFAVEAEPTQSSTGPTERLADRAEQLST